MHQKNLERILYILSLAGIGLTLHIALWYGEGGGADDPFCGVGSNCIGVIASDPAPLGIPSAWWGFMLYAAIALGSVMISRNIGGWGNFTVKVRAALVGIGWIYSAFLTILQAVAIDGWCQLCLYSFSIITLITGLTFYGFLKNFSFNLPRKVPLRENIFHGVVAALLFVFLIWDYSNVENPTAEPSSIAETDINPALCTYAADSPTFENLDQFVMEYDPVIGPADAPVLVVDFLDPNCNHCKAVHPHIKALAEAYPDSVRVVFKPVAIVGGPTHSRDEIAALYFANERGVFQEMLDLVFQHQSPATGLSVDRLVNFAEDLGLDGGDLRRAIRTHEYAHMTVRTQRIFNEMGFTGVPLIIVDGKRISSSSRHIVCLKKFVERSQSQS